MEVLALLADARAAGLDVQADGEALIVRGPRSAAALAAQLGARKPEVMALLAREDAEVAWRVAAFRAAIPAHGPIWPPRIRNTPQTNMPDHCSLCGDELPVDLVPRFPRCAPCVRALALALHVVREGVRA